MYGIKDRTLMKLLPPVFGCDEAAFAAAVKDSGDISVTAARLYRDPLQVAGGSGSKAGKPASAPSVSAGASVAGARANEIVDDGDSTSRTASNGRSSSKQWGGLHSRSLTSAAVQSDVDDDETVMGSARRSSADEPLPAARDGALADAALISSDDDGLGARTGSVSSSNSAQQAPSHAGAATGSASSSSSSSSASGPWLGRAPRAPPAAATLTLHVVDSFLSKLASFSKDNEYARALSSFVPRCTARELKWLIRVIRKDLRTGAQASLYLQALGGQPAIDMYRRCALLDDVVTAFAPDHGSSSSSASTGGTSTSGAKRPRAVDDSSSAAAAGSGKAAKRARVSDDDDAIAVVEEDDDAVVVSDDDGMAACSSTQQAAGGASALRAEATGSDAGASSSAGAIRPGVPVKPMLAAPVTSIAQGMAKMKAGMVSWHPFSASVLVVPHRTVTVTPLPLICA